MIANPIAVAARWFHIRFPQSAVLVPPLCRRTAEQYAEGVTEMRWIAEGSSNHQQY
jgi:hypothetical protein